MEVEVAEPMPYPQHRAYDSAEGSPYPTGMIQRSFVVFNGMLSEEVVLQLAVAGIGENTSILCADQLSLLIHIFHATGECRCVFRAEDGSVWRYDEYQGDYYPEQRQEVSLPR